MRALVRLLDFRFSDSLSTSVSVVDKEISGNFLYVGSIVNTSDKFVSFLYGGIAICDILMALGQLLASITSILVFLGHVNPKVLYYSIYGYMAIALTGKLSKSRHEPTYLSLKSILLV